ncbi:protein stum homolog isoform X2 [Lineus longissimus]|uniref:protein stum homolog isoform X2 n=1 Tax=Lineus longissimus TaxID=88925 RepID=UPI00315C4F17
MSTTNSKEHEKIEITITSETGTTDQVPLTNNEHEAQPTSPVKKDTKNTLQPPKIAEQEQRYEILKIEEKHGPLHNAIPVMPLPLAIVCCLLNIGCPGLGTLISSFTVFCGASTRITKRSHAFLLNLLAAFLQMLSFIIIVGWIWSILWGMTFIQLRLSQSESKPAAIPYYVRRQSSVDYRTAE